MEEAGYRPRVPVPGAFGRGFGHARWIAKKKGNYSGLGQSCVEFVRSASAARESPARAREPCERAQQDLLEKGKGKGKGIPDGTMHERHALTCTRMKEPLPDRCVDCPLFFFFCAACFCGFKGGSSSPFFHVIFKDVAPNLFWNLSVAGDQHRELLRSRSQRWEGSHWTEPWPMAFVEPIVLQERNPCLTPTESCESDETEDEGVVAGPRVCRSLLFRLQTTALCLVGGNAVGRSSCSGQRLLVSGPDESSEQAASRTKPLVCTSKFGGRCIDWVLMSASMGATVDQIGLRKKAFTRRHSPICHVQAASLLLEKLVVDSPRMLPIEPIIGPFRPLLSVRAAEQAVCDCSLRRCDSSWENADRALAEAYSLGQAVGS